MLCILTGPQAESIVMFSGNYYSLHSRLFSYSCPLAGVQFGWVKLRRLLITITPFLIGKGVHIKMNKSVILQFLPDGKITGTLAASEADEKSVMSLAAGEKLVEA